MVDRERIELSISGCKPDVFPLALTAHETWYCIGVTIPSSHLERVETSPEVECSIKIGSVCWDRTNLLRLTAGHTHHEYQDGINCESSDITHRHLQPLDILLCQFALAP